jgi:transposase
VSRLRREVKHALEDGARCLRTQTAATCFEILKVEEGLWTFARVKGIEPTNNAAERALRHAVIWRRISGGTDSVNELHLRRKSLPVGGRFAGKSRPTGRYVWDRKNHRQVFAGQRLNHCHAICCVRGSRFVERMLTVVAPCRQQVRNVLEYLTACFEADRRGQALPSLLPGATPEIKVV